MTRHEHGLPIAVGIDIGGSTIKVGLVQDGKILDKRTFPTNVGGGAEAALEKAAVCVREMQCDSCAIQVVGVGLPGLVRDGKLVAAGNLSGWEGVSIEQILTGHLGITVHLYTDICAMAIAELMAGTIGPDERALVFVIGTGFGSAAVFDGVAYGGAAGLMLTPFSHDAVPDEGLTLLEDLAAGPGIARRTAGTIPETDPSMDAEHVAKLARSGDAEAVAVWEKTGEYVGWAVVNAAHLLWLDKVVLTGGVGLAGDLLLRPVQAYFDRHINPFLRDTCKIVVSSLCQDAGIIGVAESALTGRVQKETALFPSADMQDSSAL